MKTKMSALRGNLQHSGLPEQAALPQYCGNFSKVMVKIKL